MKKSIEISSKGLSNAKKLTPSFVILSAAKESECKIFIFNILHSDSFAALRMTKSDVIF